MKRDMDLIREILLRVEKSTNPPRDIDLNIPEYNEIEISYHISLMFKAGLIEAIDTSTLDGNKYLITGLDFPAFTRHFLASKNNLLHT